MRSGAVQGRPSAGRRLGPHGCPAGLGAAAQLRVSAPAGSVAHRGWFSGAALEDAVQAVKSHQPFSKLGFIDLQEHMTCFQRQYGVLWS